MTDPFFKNNPKKENNKTDQNYNQSTTQTRKIKK
jgi:hypothetical protein